MGRPETWLGAFCTGAGTILAPLRLCAFALKLITLRQEVAL